MGVRTYMPYTDYADDTVNDQQFEQIYQVIRSDLTHGKAAEKEKCTIILGGQPGSGKSSFYRMRDDLLNYIAINGDEYRRFHPNYQNIIKTDPEHYAERTQKFSNRVVEKLITDLGSNGYNLIIEGTLRNPNVPINTCKYLQSQGYNPTLVVVACDAEKAWLSTLSRASLLKSQGLAPRLVPIDVYDITVNNIADSLQQIEESHCFASITIINREGEILYPDDSQNKASDILSRALNLDNWRQKLPFYKKDFIQKKIAILQDALHQSDIDNDLER